MPSRPAASPPFVAGPFRLHPFRGLMLAPGRVGDPASGRAFARPYRQVAKRLRSWERQGRVLHHERPAVYVHEYSTGGVTVRGLVGALDVSVRTEDSAAKVVLPHEGIHPAQAGELAARMTEMQLNPAPILLVHRGPQRIRELLTTAAGTAPDHDFVDRVGQQHRIWPLRDPQVLAELADALAPARALVADGHHRYEAYLRMQQERPGGPADTGLAMLVDQDDTPLFLGAIHRVLPGAGFDDVRSAAAGLGRFVESDRTEAVAALAPDTVTVTDGVRWGSLELAPSGGRAAIEVLHEDLVPAMPNRVRRIGYHHAVDTALDEVARKPGVAVLMPAPDFDVVRRILAADRLLPEKATSFQPKPSLGVLMRSLLDG